MTHPGPTPSDQITRCVTWYEPGSTRQRPSAFSIVFEGHVVGGGRVQWGEHNAVRLRGRLTWGGYWHLFRRAHPHATKTKRSYRRRRRNRRSQ